MREAGFPGTAVAIFPSDAAAYRSDGFRSFAEGFEVYAERVVAVEMGEGSDAVRRAEDRAGMNSPVDL
ncbi:MAG: hypothetical protein AB1555_01070 [Nitrospirota bacterium]